MNERDWLTSADPWAMLDHLFPDHSQGTPLPNPRKLRRYYIACARNWSPELPLVADTCLDAAERLADDPPHLEHSWNELYDIAVAVAHSGGDDDAERVLADCRMRYAALGYPMPAAARAVVPRGWSDRVWGVRYGWLLVMAVAPTVPPARQLHRSLHDADVVREIFGNPFRSRQFLDEWRTERILGLARACYDEPAFNRLPILADALTDAGCDDDGLLAHLRDHTVPHVRGCWALDLVLNL